MPHFSLENGNTCCLYEPEYGMLSCCGILVLLNIMDVKC